MGHLTSIPKKRNTLLAETHRRYLPFLTAKLAVTNGLESFVAREVLLHHWSIRSRIAYLKVQSGGEQATPCWARFGDHAAPRLWR